MQRSNVNLGAVLPLSTLAVLATPVIAQVSVEEDATNVGLVARHNTVDEGIPGGQEMMTGGMAVGDFNNDGHPDLFWVSGGVDPDKLFINDGTGNFTDDAASWGVAIQHCGNGASVMDYNNDGWDDIYVTSFGPTNVADGAPGYNRLYRNNGDSTFTEVAVDAGVNFSSPTAGNGWSSAWGDYNLDGQPDLFVTCWRSVIFPPESDGNRLYKNNGDGTFTDVTATALGAAIVDVQGFTPAFVDMNGDLYPEILLAADFETSRYFENNGDGTFTDRTIEYGCGLDDNGMGQTIGDYDNDGDFEWYVTSIFRDNPNENQNPGNMLYTEIEGGLDEVSEEAGTLDGGWAWGAISIDFDQNGLEDIVVVNGWPSGTEWLDERAKLFYNNGGLNFTEMAFDAGLLQNGQGRSIVSMDADGDGDVDMAIGGRREWLEYYRNTTEKAGHWLQVSLDTSTNALLAPRGLGAIIKVTVGGVTQMRVMNGSPSFLATSQMMAHFGTGRASVIDEVRIEWPRGQVTTMQNVAADQALNIAAPALADLNGDGVVSTDDLLMFLARYGDIDDAHDLLADFDGDGDADVNDLLYLLANWN